MLGGAHNQQAVSTGSSIGASNTMWKRIFNSELFLYACIGTISYATAWIAVCEFGWRFPGFSGELGGEGQSVLAFFALLVCIFPPTFLLLYVVIADKIESASKVQRQ